MNQVTIQTADDIVRSDRLRPLITRASEWLLDVVKDPPVPVRARWSVTRQMRTGREYIELVLSSPGVVTEHAGLFAPEELGDQGFAESAIRSIYLDLLQFQTHRLLDEIREPLSAPAVR